MSRLLPGSARRPVRALARRGYLYLPVTAVVLAVALAVTLAPRGLSSADATAAAAATPATAATPAAAPNDGGITWTPDGTPVQANNGSGDCETAMSGTVVGPAAAVAEVGSVLDGEGPDPVNQDDIGTVKVSAPAAASGTSMAVYADAGVGCDAITQADAYIRGAGYAGPVGFARAHPARPGPPAAPRAALLAYDLPAWLRAAIAAVTVGVVFIAVSVAVAAALAALLAATGGTVASAVLSLISGCIAGLAAGPIGAAIATGGKLTVAPGLASALAGCFAGTTVSGPLGLTWISSVFQSLGWTGGTAVAAVDGAALEADAAAAGAALEPVEVQLGAITAAAGG